MSTTNTTQITLRHVSPNLKAAIDKQAHAAGKSINQFVLDLVKVCVGVKSTKEKPDWHKFIGAFPEDAFDQSDFDYFEAIDEKMWK